MRLNLHKHALVVAVAAGLLAPLVPLPSLAFGASFETAPGSSAKVGSGTTYCFKVQVQRSISVDPRAFAADVEEVLFDDRSWTGSGAVAFKRVATGGNTQIILARPRQVDKLCFPLQTAGIYSCSIGEKVVLNLGRWRRGVPDWSDSRPDYRRMLVNHEVGHRIGHGHRSCSGRGAQAPVMQQQTIDLQGCVPNWWPTEAELQATRQLHAGTVAASTKGAAVE
jgi:hypothetical protein